MWLEKIVFCGKSFGPTSNYQIIDEQLAIGSSIPLAKDLLGAVYNPFIKWPLACQPTPQ
jgi:hypothetical protein